MSAPATEKFTEKEVVINGTSEVDGEVTDVKSTPQLQCKNTTQSESLTDWFVMVCVILCNVMNGINLAAYGVLYLPITEMFHASRAAVGWIQSFDFALGSFIGIFFSHPVNVYGCRLPGTIGSLLIVIGGVLSCLSPSLVWMYILKGIIPGIGQSTAMLTCNVIIQQRFNKHRSLATGISIIGWSVGYFIGAPLTELLLNQYGLRGTLALLGAIQAHRIPVALQFRSPRRFIRSRNTTKSSEMTDKQTSCDKLKHYIRGSLDFTLLRKTTFLLFCITGVMRKFIENCYMPHTVNWAMAAGVPRDLAVWAVSFLMCFPPLLISGVVGTYLSTVLFGFQSGCANTLMSVVMVDLQGVENIARCLALHDFFISFAFLTGSPFMGLMYDVTGSYNVGFIILACIALTALSLMTAVIIIDRRSRKLTKTSNIDLDNWTL